MTACDARVLLVDDSAAMRALFSDILEQSRGITVVGTAANAQEALDMIPKLRPNVLTLDVEMPGMSGIELLEKIMNTEPLPCVMLSSLTQKGTETSLKAYEIGAVECFPKPLKATAEQFQKSVSKLGKIVIAAANSNVRKRRAVAVEAESQAEFEWSGHIVAMSASMGGVEALSVILSSFPANCPPTVVTLQCEPEVVEALINRLDADLPCSVLHARDGAKLVQGTVHIASDPAQHVTYEAGAPPVIRLISREPIEGARPSANLLFGTIARANAQVVGLVLTGLGSDGAKGLRLMRDAGCRTFAQSQASSVVSEAPRATMEAGAAEKEIDLDAIAGEILAACSAR